MTSRGQPAIPVRKDVLVDGLETSFLEAGAGEPLILLHGGEFGGEAEICWRETIPALAKHFRVIAPDLLGFGRTAKIVDFVDGRMRRLRHLARFVELVGATGAPCVGNSMGGMLLLFDAASNAPLLAPRKLVSIAGGGLLNDNTHVEALFDYDGSVEGMRRIVEALFYGERWRQDEDYMAERRASSLAPGAWEAVAAARFRRPKDLQEVRSPSPGIDYARINTEALIVAGAADKLKPFGWWNDLIDEMAHASSFVVPDTGHCPQIERPDLVNEALIDFLTREGPVR